MDNNQQNYQDDKPIIDQDESQSDTEINEAIDDVEFESYNEDVAPVSKLSPENKIIKLREKLNESDKLKQEYLDGWQRLKADYVNLKKRCEDEKSEIGKFAKESFVGDFIPVIESFDMAFSNKEAWEKVEPTWRVGVEYIHKQFIEVLNSYGLTELNPINEIFDPQIHTAIENIKTEDENLDHKVAEVVQKGYKVGDRIIKSPKVKVYVFN